VDKLDIFGPQSCTVHDSSVGPSLLTPSLSLWPWGSTFEACKSDYSLQIDPKAQTRQYFHDKELCSGAIFTILVRLFLLGPVWCFVLSLFCFFLLFSLYYSKDYSHFKTAS
jgi:hypothetical protein